jgi:ribosomal protein L2
LHPPLDARRTRHVLLDREDPVHRDVVDLLHDPARPAHLDEVDVVERPEAEVIEVRTVTRPPDDLAQEEIGAGPNGYGSGT